ncbi:MAG: DUF4339 domain-containing protein [Phycisphaerae bacterium]
MGILIIWIIGGVIIGVIAYYKGRNPVGWAIFGALFTILALILVLVLPNLNQQRKREQFDDRERRRLQEQLRQERLKNEAFRQHASVRLDQHDHTLGVDTRQQPQLAAEAVGDVRQFAPASGQLEAESNWFYLDGAKSIGPMSLQDIRLKCDTGELDANSMVWHSSMQDWQPAGSTDALADRF